MKVILSHGWHEQFNLSFPTVQCQTSLYFYYFSLIGWSINDVTPLIGHSFDLTQTNHFDLTQTNHSAELDLTQTNHSAELEGHREAGTHIAESDRLCCL